jgi:hypothetical protein
MVVLRKLVSFLLVRLGPTDIKASEEKHRCCHTQERYLNSDHDARSQKNYTMDCDNPIYIERFALLFQILTDATKSRFSPECVPLNTTSRLEGELAGYYASWLAIVAGSPSIVRVVVMYEYMYCQVQCTVILKKYLARQGVTGTMHVYM